MSKIGIIIGSTRPGRAGDKIAKWLYEQIKDTGMEYELVDLLDYDLPLLDEPVSASQHQYSKDHTKKWAAKIDSFDGYIWVTAEYNHGVPGALKNAIDYLNFEWRKKPVGILSYGTVGGVRAAEHLKQTAGEVYMHDIRHGLYVLAPWAALDEKGNVKPENFIGDIKAFTEELTWWTEALKKARAEQ
jgi:NAD(P)H-dependent FMN reductase